MKRGLVLSGLFLFLFVGVALADQLDTLYYQKKLSSALTTSAKMTTVNVTFSLYDAPKGGNLLWSETKPILTNHATRLITTNLGDTNPLSETDFKPQMWVQVSTTNSKGIKVYGSRDILEGAPYALSTENIIIDENANTAIGKYAFNTASTGQNDTASGYCALFFNTTGGGNTASGTGALYSNTTGSYNTALGYLAGCYGNNTTGSNNIYIGHGVSPAAADESYTIRIGSDQTQTFFAGISGATVTGGTAVYVDSNGHLGTVSSSRRYKEDIENMGDASSGLMKLRPVAFHYKPEYAKGPRTMEYGLIAEEVAEVYPDLVQYDPKTGQPETVYYHLVNAMLLNEVQKQQKELSALKEQQKELSALVEQNKELSTRLSKLEAQLNR
ncbi:MAG: tail fiber domain-containing protein [Syntrophobacteraceae bacterium]